MLQVIAVRLLNILKRVLEPKFNDIKIRFSNCWFTAKLVLNSRFQDLFGDAKHLAYNSNIKHVLHVTLQISWRVHLLHQGLDGHGIDNNLFVRDFGLFQVVSVEQYPTIAEVRDVLLDGSWVHRHDHIIVLYPSGVSTSGSTNHKPGWQAFDIGREDILP